MNCSERKRNNLRSALNLCGILFPLLVLMNSCSHRIAWQQLASLPDHEGFAGAFAGVSQGTLLVAGGANFPGKKPWEGGQKVWYDTVFVLEKPDAQWKTAGRLPRPLGYGISVSTREGVVCIGGSDAEKHHAEVFVLALRGGQVATKPLPSLPIALANGAGALLGETIFVFGGSEQPGEQSALNRLFALDLAAPQRQWKELEMCPGKPRILPVAAVANGAFHIAGGAGLEQTNGKVARVYLRDAWSYQPGSGWKRLADLPKPSVAAPSPAPVVGSEFFIVGGDDGSLAGFTPIEKHPGFPRTIVTYDARTSSWSTGGEIPASRATLPAVFWQGRWVLPSGEARPGVRSPEVWTLRGNE
jgi:N-acetylneuraminate epimerase